MSNSSSEKTRYAECALLTAATTVKKAKANSARSANLATFTTTISVLSAPWKGVSSALTRTLAPSARMAIQSARKL